eukprot:scaffold134716_cov31-Tisochrysis_lutea.AAC.6
MSARASSSTVVCMKLKYSLAERKRAGGGGAHAGRGGCGNSLRSWWAEQSALLTISGPLRLRARRLPIGSSAS